MVHQEKSNSSLCVSLEICVSVTFHMKTTVQALSKWTSNLVLNSLITMGFFSFFEITTVIS